MRSTGCTVTVVLVAAMVLGGIACARDGSEPTEDGGAASAAPDAVQQTWRTFGGSVDSSSEVEHDTEHGLDIWSAEFADGEGSTEVTALADGTLVSLEREVALELVPEVVRDHAMRVLGVEPDRLERVRLAVYELEDRDVDGVVRERYVDPFGNVLLTRHVDPATENEVTETLDELPAAARAAIERETHGATLGDLQREADGGHEVHAASWQAADGARELKVLNDGTVLSLELPTGALPERVVALVEGEDRGVAGDDEDDDDGSGSRGGGSVGVERMLLDAWEADVAVGETVRQAVVLPTGELLGDVTSEEHDSGDAE
jgi:hypothetical protein